MAYSRRAVEHPGDRVVLEQALARELLATYLNTGKRVMTQDRLEWIEKRYGSGASKRVIEYMKRMQAGDLL
jgi:hypothetical protein